MISIILSIYVALSLPCNDQSQGRSRVVTIFQPKPSMQIVAPSDVDAVERAIRLLIAKRQLRREILTSVGIRTAERQNIDLITRCACLRCVEGTLDATSKLDGHGILRVIVAVTTVGSSVRVVSALCDGIAADEWKAWRADGYAFVGVLRVGVEEVGVGAARTSIADVELSGGILCCDEL